MLLGRVRFPYRRNHMSDLTDQSQRAVTNAEDQQQGATAVFLFAVLIVAMLLLWMSNLP